MPRPKTMSVARRISSSAMPLLIAARSRSEPASGAIEMVLWPLLARRSKRAANTDPAGPAASTRDLREIHVAELGIRREYDRCRGLLVNTIERAFFDAIGRGRLTAFSDFYGLVFIIKNIVKLRHVRARDRTERPQIGRAHV